MVEPFDELVDHELLQQRFQELFSEGWLLTCPACRAQHRVADSLAHNSKRLICYKCHAQFNTVKLKSDGHLFQQLN